MSGEQENTNYEIGTCCFCGGECNAASQDCGTCARRLTGWALGWYPKPVWYKN